MLSLILVIPVSRDQAAWETIPPLCFPPNQGLLPFKIQGFGVFHAVPAPFMPPLCEKHSQPKPWTHSGMVTERRGKTVTQGLGEISGDAD